MTESTLTKKQKKVFGPKHCGKGCTIKAEVRFDDECGNGHNTFAITGEIRDRENRIVSSGCIHKEIAQAFPELRSLIKFHLCSTDEPMHYGANTLYHALEHGPIRAWVWYTGESDPLQIAHLGNLYQKERLIGYVEAEVAKRAEGQPGYRVEWDEKTIKVRNLEHARSSAVWLDATDEELTAPGLEDRLKARLPALMKEFREAVESLGFTW